jgi:lipopolysaccharide transport system ATP-binding protein
MKQNKPDISTNDLKSSTQDLAQTNGNGHNQHSSEVETKHAQGDVVLKVENVSKKFCRNLKRSMLHGITDLAKGMVGVEPDTTTLRKDEFWALKDINFELREGEILGIIGANGSGKSTLLRVLTGIFPPDKGRIWMDGTVGGIIALGAGMHPHMTGRENIYLNGTLFGMTREEIDEKIDDIIEFSEIGEFMDAPLSAYSSGMKVRLGFSVAIHCEPRILLVDEVLAVGDVGFKKKSLNKILDHLEDKSVIFISHDMKMISRICDRVIFIDKGYIVDENYDIESVIINYENKFQETVSVEKSYDKLELIDIKLDKKSFIQGEFISGVITLNNNTQFNQLAINIVVNDNGGNSLIIVKSNRNGPIDSRGIISVCFRFKNIFNTGNYNINININSYSTENGTDRKLFFKNNVAKFESRSGTKSPSFGRIKIELESNWHINGKEQN